MIYTLSNVEKKQTSTGKEKADVTLTNPAGTSVQKVTIWGDFPNFANLQDGMTVDGDYSEKVNGQYTNRTLYPSRQATTSYGANRGSGGIAKAQATKAEGIAKSMDRKEESIKESSTFRDATIMATAIFNKSEEASGSEDLQRIWLRQRDFLLENYEYKEPKTTSKGYNGEAPIVSSEIPF